MRKEKLLWTNVIQQSEINEYKKMLQEILSLSDEEFAAMSEEKKEQACYELVAEDKNTCLDDERQNLDIQLSNDIIIIADLGLWNGRKQGYKIIESGNIKDILYSEADYVKWYSDGYNIRCNAHHHDGTNYYLYREFKDISDTQKENFLEKIYNGEEISSSMLSRYTRSILPHINKVYGW